MMLLIKYTLLYAMVLMLVALGGCFSEHSGIVNIALEGIMTIGGLVGIAMLVVLPEGSPNFVILLVSIGAAGLSGILYSALLAFASINLKADQVIGGTALNLLATALAVVIARRFNSGTQSAKLSYSNAPFLFNIGGFTINIFLFIGIALLLLAIFVMYRTRFGLRLRACGEHPQAADSVGINVYHMRWWGVLISGFLGGIGGFAYIVPAVQTWNFEVGVAGMGFLSLAVMIFGQWKPARIFYAAMFFAVFKALANIADSTFLAALAWPKEIYNMMPFIASMVILAFTSKKSRAPKAEGIPYDKGSR
ncbi:MAG: ABC transporter permease [Clostridia bacterium]|nr:ABC transporter permease [Clostridia bacterium]